MKGLSYWGKLEGGGQIVWEGIIFGREENDGLKISLQETDPQFVQILKMNRGLNFTYEPVWEDVTDKYRLPSGSSNA